jgi:hypothetical protein
LANHVRSYAISIAVLLFGSAVTVTFKKLYIGAPNRGESWTAVDPNVRLKTKIPLETLAHAVVTVAAVTACLMVVG